MSTANPEAPAQAHAGLSPRTKWRAAFRFVLENLPWLRESAHPQADKPKDQLLDLQDKLILSKEPWKRTEEEKQLVRAALRDFGELRHYSESLQNDLIDSLVFVHLRRGRVLTQEGAVPHPWGGVYFVAGGELELTYMQKDRVTGQTAPAVVGRRRAGEVFGDITLLQPPRKNTCVVTSEYCEVLVLRVKDFDRILRDILVSRYEKFEKALQLPYFKTWTEEEKNQCKHVSEFQDFQKDEIIIGPGERKESTYFLLRGECELISALTVDKRNRGGFFSYSLHADQEESLPPSAKGETVFLSLCTLKPGAVFSLGEDMKCKVVISKTDNTSCFKIPKRFLEMANENMIWDRTRYFLESKIPSVGEQLRWLRNSRRLATARAAGANPAMRVASDAPITVRAAEPDPVELHAADPPADLRQILRIEKEVIEFIKKEQKK